MSNLGYFPCVTAHTALVMDHDPVVIDPGQITHAGPTVPTTDVCPNKLSMEGVMFDLPVLTLRTVHTELSMWQEQMHFFGKEIHFIERGALQTKIDMAVLHD